MSETKKILMTYEGVKKLEQELEYLKTVKRKEITEKIKIALGYGDLSENSEYDEAKNAQEANETKIATLEETLRNAEIIDENKINTKVVQVGNTVHITGVKTKTEKIYTIVGPPEVDILENKISNESPLGKALIGNKKGDIVSVEAPNGIVEYKIDKITVL